MRRFWFGLFSIFYFLFSIFSPVLTLAEDLTATNFILRDSILLNSGGTVATSTNFQNMSGVGQVIIGESSSTNFTNQLGIFYFSLATTASSGSGTTTTSSGGSAVSFGGASGGLVQKLISIAKKLISPRGHLTGGYLMGDLNKDGRVDIYDVSILFYQWGAQTGRKQLTANIGQLGFLSADLNNDQQINVKDLSIMLYNWTN